MRATLTVCLLALSATSAAADVRGDVEGQLYQDAYRLSRFSIDELKEYGKCRPMLALAKKKLKPTDKLRSGHFKIHPKAVQDGDDYVITVADIPWLCDEIDRAMTRGTLAATLEDGKRYQEQLAKNPELDTNPNVRIGAGAYDLGRAKTCAADVAKEKAAGATKLDWKGTSYDLSDAEALCAAVGAWGEYMNKSGEANFEKVAPKYRALGVDGDRLRLFVEYENVSFRGKRCEIIDGLEVLAKQKYVHQWLENADGTHTIRTYTFKGNKYSVKDKTFLTEAKAYKGCK